MMKSTVTLLALAVLTASAVASRTVRLGSAANARTTRRSLLDTPKDLPPSPPLASVGPLPEGISDTPFLIGVSQYEEVYWDMAPSIAKACQHIKAAGAAGVKLLLFPEGAISGYPWFNWWASTYEIAANEKMNEIFMMNSPQIRADGGDLRPIMECARDARVNVALPINERDNHGSEAAVFNTLVFIDLNGNIVGRHRKTTPSYTERMWWTFGDGSDLIVVDMPEVGRVCGLLCWENYMPLARYTLVAQGCEFWMAPTQDIGNHWVGSMQMVARESRAYVMTIGQLFRPTVAAKSAIATVSAPGMLVSWAANMMAAYDQIHNAGAVGEYMMDGGGAILNPEGVPIAGPVYASCNYCLKDNHTYSYDWARAGCALPVKGPENIGLPGCTVIDIPGLPAGEIILAAPASRATVYRKKLYQDAVGNYARPDIWSVTWHNAPKDTMFTDIPMTTDGLKGYDAGAAQFDAPGDAAPNGPIRLEDPEL